MQAPVCLYLSHFVCKRLRAVRPASCPRLFCANGISRWLPRPPGGGPASGAASPGSPGHPTRGAAAVCRCGRQGRAGERPEESQPWAGSQDQQSRRDKSTTTKRLHKYLLRGCDKPGAKPSAGLHLGRDRRDPTLSSRSVTVQAETVRGEAAAVSTVAWGARVLGANAGPRHRHGGGLPAVTNDRQGPVTDADRGPLSHVAVGGWVRRGL